MRDNRNVNMDGGHKRNMDRSDTTLVNFMHASHAYILVGKDHWLSLNSMCR